MRFAVAARVLGHDVDKIKSVYRLHNKYVSPIMDIAQ